MRKIVKMVLDCWFPVGISTGVLFWSLLPSELLWGYMVALLTVPMYFDTRRWKENRRMRALSPWY